MADKFDAKPFEERSLNTHRNNSYVQNCDGDTAKRVTDPCVEKAVKSGPLAGIHWKAHTKVVASNVVTYTFFNDPAKTELLATGVLTYADATLCDLVGSVWSYP